MCDYYNHSYRRTKMRFRLLEPIVFYGLALAAAALFGASYISNSISWQSYVLLGCAVVLVISATGYCWSLAQESLITRIKLHNQQVAQQQQQQQQQQKQSDESTEACVQQLNAINEDLVGMLDMIKDFEKTQKKQPQVENKTEVHDEITQR